MDSKQKQKQNMTQLPSPPQLSKLQNLHTDCTQLSVPLTYSNSYFNGQLSFTQKQIFSHQIISQIYEQSNKNTVQHHVNFIPKQTKLYVQKNVDDEDQLKDSVEGKQMGKEGNEDFQCTTAVKVQEIKRRLSESKKLSQRLTQIANRNKQKASRYKSVRAVSADNVNKRVSISGLVTYNFNSVNARRSLGSIPDQPEQQKLQQNIKAQKQRTTKSQQRRSHILSRKPNPFSFHRQQLSNASICDFHTPTDKFLSLLHKQSKKDELIYGQKMQKLTCVKEYMENQKTDFQNAKYIVEAVVKASEKGIDVRKGKRKYVTDDDQELARRRKVVGGRKKVMLRHLYFTQL